MIQTAAHLLPTVGTICSQTHRSGKDIMLHRWAGEDLVDQFTFQRSEMRLRAAGAWPHLVLVVCDCKTLGEHLHLSPPDGSASLFYTASSHSLPSSHRDAAQTGREWLTHPVGSVQGECPCLHLLQVSKCFSHSSNGKLAEKRCPGSKNFMLPSKEGLVESIRFPSNAPFIAQMNFLFARAVISFILGLNRNTELWRHLVSSALSLSQARGVSSVCFDQLIRVVAMTRQMAPRMWGPTPGDRRSPATLCSSPLFLPWWFFLRSLTAEDFTAAHICRLVNCL